jgi:hypothetical protein
MRIGICGYAESGKDVVADYLVEHRGFVKVNMSDALDRYLRILNPLVPHGDEMFRYDDLRQAMDLTTAKRNPEVRQLLQRLGTDVGRAIDPQMWVKEMEKEASKHDRVVTTGIRFIEETYPLNWLIHVERPGVGPVNGHPSDSIDEIIKLADIRLINDGTIDDLHAEIAASLLGVLL